MIGSVDSRLSPLSWSGYLPGSRTQGASSAPGGESSATDPLSQAKEKDLKRLGLKECKTCQNRTYVDVSNDPGVSFKTPTRLSPAAADSAVRAHEGEHVSRESAKAESENRKVISQSVQIYTDICPECGRMYTSGGKTTTVTAPQSGQTTSVPKGQLFDQIA